MVRCFVECCWELFCWQLLFSIYSTQCYKMKANQIRS